MRKKLSLLAGAAFLAFFAMGCEGPQGPQGLPGADGQDGQDGADGVNAAETCTDCHNDDTQLFAIQVQYNASVHRNGREGEPATFERGYSTSCAGCHTHEGHMEVMAAADPGGATAAPITNPSPVNCRTCHAIHTSYTQADYARIYNAPVPLLVGGATFDLGEGNLCASCHQSRTASPAPDLANPGTTISITSSRYGFHHGPQSNTVSASGAFEFVSVAGPNTHGNATGNPNGCVTCHMANPRGNQAGGHTWSMEYEYHGSVRDYTESCDDAACHDGAFDDDFDATSRQTNVQNLLDLIEADLFARGIIDATGHVIASSTTPLVIRNDLAAAFLNWQMLSEDRSVGIHSPMWVQGVLQETLDTLTILP